ncbi:MAG TPA: HepT-like ribonuclease domain-containing protein [Candidatus Hypogeohydataceae bacterium YC41]
MRNYRLYLKDIFEAMEATEKFVEGMGFEDFKKDDKTSSAVIRKFEIIGEAAKNVPDSIKENYTLIPWREMAGMRDRLIHFYFGIKYDLVWKTIKEVIPQVKPLIRKVLDDLEIEK